jgi:pimeloyl-ACP methyl ester carboxylesterase
MTVLKAEYIEVVPNIKLHVMVGGAKEGNLLIFLHGFPEYWVSFKEIAEHFIQQGYRVMLPDMRGYHLSDKPKGISHYTSKKLAEDIIALIDYENREKATVIGHDWGAIVTWALASNYSKRLEKVIILNVPHPSVLTNELKQNIQQLKNSWYIFFIQIPFLPELFLSAMNFKFLSKKMFQMLTHSKTMQNRPGSQAYIDAWKMPQALTSMLNYYRAIPRSLGYSYQSPIDIPVLIIWGDQDNVLVQSMADDSSLKCTNAKVVHIPEGGHFVQHDCPDKVKMLIEDFIN